MDFIDKFLSADGFMPHGHCYMWETRVMWLHIISDSFITIAYFTIPVTLTYIVRKRKDLPFNWIFACFGVFILACGMTHAFEVVTVWNPLYRLTGSVKAVTAVASIATAILLVKLIPQILAIPSLAALREANEALQKEIGERRRTEALLRMAGRIGRLGAWSVEVPGHAQTWSDEVCAIYGTAPGTVLTAEAAMRFYTPESQQLLTQAFETCVRDGTPYDVEVQRVKPDGESLWLRNIGEAERDAAGAVCRVQGALQDITSRYEAELRIQASLAEKEVLLREIHHRVKNNLQVITSLLQLQTGYLHDPRDAEMFQECQARIHAMGLVHDRLYRSGNLATIDFSEHLRELTTLIARGQAQASDRIRLVVETEPVQMDLDMAIPLGLIVAELITNTYKHAFRERSDGLVTVRLFLEGEDQLSLTVEDDGVGLPAGLEPEMARTLGLRLIRALARQLRAEISIASTEAGTRFSLRFPLSSGKAP